MGNELVEIVKGVVILVVIFAVVVLEVYVQRRQDELEERIRDLEERARQKL